jgi:hypothetical protein
MSKESPCLLCDHICQNNPYNPDEECMGSLTAEQHEALNKTITVPKQLIKEEKHENSNLQAV